MHADQNLALHTPQGQIQGSWFVVSPMRLVCDVSERAIILIVNIKDPRLKISGFTQNYDEA